jgi:C1A family cysteine protease
MFALATVGPVTVNVDAIPFQSYGGGLMTGCAIDKTHIDHVVQLVGYGRDTDAGKDYWLLRNSWDTSWGIQGYIHAPGEWRGTTRARSGARSTSTRWTAPAAPAGPGR